MEKEEMKKRIAELEAAMREADFWADKNRAQAQIRELQDLKLRLESGSALEKGGAILSLVAGAGGDDAEDFAAMLLDMYRKYMESRGWRMRVLHENKNDRGGYRNFAMEIGDGGAYGTLKNEYGGHRLVRGYPFFPAPKPQNPFFFFAI